MCLNVCGRSVTRSEFRHSRTALEFLYPTPKPFISHSPSTFYQLPYPYGAMMEQRLPLMLMYGCATGTCTEIEKVWRCIFWPPPPCDYTLHSHKRDRAGWRWGLERVAGNIKLCHTWRNRACVCVCDCTRETVSTFGMCSANIQEKVILVANIFNTYSVRGPFSWNGPQIASSGNKLDRRRGQSRLTRGAGFPLGKIRICVRGKILQHCVGRRVRI